VAEELFAKGLCLPSGTAMSEEDMARVVEVIRGQRAEIRGQRSGARLQRSEGRGQKSEVRRRGYADQVGEGVDCLSDSSLDFAHDCGYISDEQHAQLTSLSGEVGKMLGSMIKSPGPDLWSLTTDH